MVMDHEIYMQEAVRQAGIAESEGEVPVGAVIVSEAGKIVAATHNSPVSLNDPTAHAEIRAIRQAALITGNYRLTGTTLYVTIEPCCMCAGALVHARIQRLVFGAWDEKAGACGSIYDIVRDNRLNHTVEVVPGIMARECSNLIRDFFKKRRR